MRSIIYIWAIPGHGKIFKLKMMKEGPSLDWSLVKYWNYLIFLFPPPTYIFSVAGNWNPSLWRKSLRHGGTTKFSLEGLLLEINFLGEYTRIIYASNELCQNLKSIPLPMSMYLLWKNNNQPVLGPSYYPGQPKPGFEMSSRNRTGLYWWPSFAILLDHS